MLTYLKHIVVNSVNYGAFMDDPDQKSNYEAIDGIIKDTLCGIFDGIFPIEVEQMVKPAVNGGLAMMLPGYFFDMTNVVVDKDNIPLAFQNYHKARAKFKEKNSEVSLNFANRVLVQYDSMISNCTFDLAVKAMREGTSKPRESVDESCPLCSNGGGEMHFAACEKLSKFNWPDHEVILGAIFRNIKKEFPRKYARLADKMRHTDSSKGPVDKTIPDIMITDGTKMVWLDYCNTINMEKQFGDKTRKYKDTYDIIPVCVSPYMQMLDKSYERLHKYVHVEKMFRDICLYKLRMLEIRKSLYERVIQQAHDSVGAATVLAAKTMRFVK